MSKPAFIAKVNNAGDISFSDSEEVIEEPVSNNGIVQDTVDNNTDVNNTDVIKTDDNNTVAKDTVNASPTQSVELSPSETVVIDHFHHILPHVMPQPDDKKWNHFMFKHKSDETAFEAALQTVDNDITVMYNFINKNKPDVTLLQHGIIIGKIHFLHMDRPDKGKTSKYYIKLHLFHFSSSDMFEKVKAVAVEFFNGLHRHKHSHKHSYKKHSITRKHSHKPHITRKHSKKHSYKHSHKPHITHKRHHKRHHKN